MEKGNQLRKKYTLNTIFKEINSIKFLNAFKLTPYFYVFLIIVIIHRTIFLLIVSVLLGAETWNVEYYLTHMIQFLKNPKSNVLRILSIQIDIFEFGAICYHVSPIQIHMMNSLTI